MEQRIEDLGDKGRGRTHSILELEKAIKETQENIMKSRQAAAANSKSRSSNGNEEGTKNVVSKEVIDEIDEEIKTISKDLQALTE